MTQDLPKRWKNLNYINYLKVGVGLLCVRDGIGPFCEQIVSQFQAKILKIHNIERKECLAATCHETAREKFRVDCPKVCNIFLKIILEQNKGNRLEFANSEIRKWSTDAWEIAKLFMDYGQPAGNNGPEKSDSAALLKLLRDCKLFSNYISTDEVKKVIDVRNATMHSSSLKLDSETMKKNIKLMVDFLQMLIKKIPTESDNLTMKSAVKKLNELMNADFATFLKNNMKSLADEEMKIIKETIGDHETRLCSIEDLTEKLKEIRDVIPLLMMIHGNRDMMEKFQDRFKNLLALSDLKKQTQFLTKTADRVADVEAEVVELRKMLETLSKPPPPPYSSRDQDADNVLIIGIYDGSNPIRDEVLKINLKNPAEMYHEDVRIPMRKEATAAVYHNTVYVVGLGTYNNEIWKYESNSGWNKCASLTQGRRRHSAAFVDEVLYICGGFVDTDKTALNSVEGYNTVDNTCKSVGKLAIPVESSGNCVAYKKSLYIFGGFNMDDEAISGVQVYDTVQNICHKMSNIVTDARGPMRAALWRESVILVGQTKCFIYNFSSKAWLVREQFKSNVGHFGLVLSNDRIYVVGGGICTTDTEGKVTWTGREDVRSVAVQDIIEDNPAQWRVNGRLTRPCFVHAFAHLNQQHDNTDEV